MKRGKKRPGNMLILKLWTSKSWISRKFSQKPITPKRMETRIFTVDRPHRAGKYIFLLSFSGYLKKVNTRTKRIRESNTVYLFKDFMTREFA
jgi:hypothetical protein